MGLLRVSMIVFTERGVGVSEIQKLHELK
jgi:hypothetical protein